MSLEAKLRSVSAASLRNFGEQKHANLPQRIHLFLPLTLEVELED